jgi:GNAT superfamily N-acetyltransferase
MKPGEASQVSTFISDVFHQFVAPGYEREGIESFMQYIQPEALQCHLRENHFTLIAESGEEIIGAIEIRDFSHVALFFVADRFQRKGVGKALLRQAVEICRQHESNLSQITVNASPNSVDAYETLGFKPVDQERCVDGIRFVPMTCNLMSEKTVA